MTFALLALALALAASAEASEPAPAAGALRGLKDTRWPMVFAAAAYWAVGMSLALGLGFGAGLGGLGIWIGLAVALAVAAALMIGRFLVLEARLARSARSRLQSTAGAPC